MIGPGSDNNYLITPLFDQASNALIWHDFIHFSASTHYHPFPSSFHIASSSYRRFLKPPLTRFLCFEIFDCLEFVGLGRNGAIPAYSFPFNSRYSDLSWIIEHRLFSPLQTSQTGKVRVTDKNSFNEIAVFSVCQESCLQTYTFKALFYISTQKKRVEREDVFHFKLYLLQHKHFSWLH